MSKVFSFRLDENNPREARAMEVIHTWASRGYSLRYVLVEALLNLKEKETQKDDFPSSLDEIIRMLQNLQAGSDGPKVEQEQENKLSDTFLKAVAKSTKPGLQAS
jgi:hypothetical protein